MREREFCICAAIKMPNGDIIHGHRHNHCYDVVRATAQTEEDRLKIVHAEQGFVTSEGRFVGRKEAMQIQKESGRPSKYGVSGQYNGDILFSEDLY